MRVDYSELVGALKKGDDDTSNRLLEEVIPRLEEYLRVVLRADENTARECVQQAFTDVYERVRKGKIKNEKYIFSYMLTASRNEFLRYSKYQHKFDSDSEAAYEQVDPAEQIESLMEKERMEILEECLFELDRENRGFIKYIIQNPDKTSKEYGAYFDITEANVRTRKSRIVNLLHHCFRRKSSQ